MKKLILGAAILALATGVSTQVMANNHGDDKEHGGHHMKMDADENGSVSKAEFLTAQEAHFTKLDADGNGEISKEEFKAKRDAMKEKMKDRHEKRQEKKDSSDKE